MLGHGRGAAWRQACTSVIVFALVAAAVVYCALRPFDRDTLAIQAGQLGSQAAEAAMSARLLREDKLGPRFARIHARQLAGKVDDVAGQLRAHPPGGLDAAHDEARIAASSLAALLRQAPPSRDPRSGAAFEAWSQRMGALQQRLEPED